jgi:uncharacterized membrane protein YgdD (TMEM256/DUF423 family)
MTKSARIGAALAALDGLMAVMFGAFAAHVVKDPAVKALLQTGAVYQLSHAVAALAAGSLRVRGAGAAVWFFASGGLLFAGSLDLVALTRAPGIGAATPIGGVLLMIGWGVLFFGFLIPRRAIP